MIRSSNFDKNLEQATSQLRLDVDWPTILKICDAIRQNDVTAKNAINSIKKKMQSQNPHSAEYACVVLESVVKNCGSPIHEEISTTSNCEFFSNLINNTKHDNVRAKMLELIQTWSFAFRSSPKYQAIKDTMNILKSEGHKFPELKESDAMFLSDTAPEWAEGDVCHRCRVAFSLTNRRHHCRNCGQVFCGKCSSKTSTIPKYGIEKDVRVCDACYTHLQKPSSGRPARTSTSESDLPAEYLSSSLAQQSQGPPKRSEQELQEEEELQLALALSQSEAEQQKSKGSGLRPRNFATVRTVAPEKRPSPEPLRKSPSPVEDVNDPELARYLNRSYWENRKTTDSPASPSAPSPALQQVTPTLAPIQAINANGMKIMPEDAEIDEFASSMKAQLDVFVNRMKSNSSRGRSISTDSSVQTLFLTMTSLHSTLLNYTKNTDDKRLWYEQLQDKLNQIRDSRAALDVLRQEHQEKLRRQAEEAERMRQYQMAQKLEIMRKKKQEYLQYQRQIALQRIQEQEREMQLRQEQQKAQYRIGAQGFPFMGQPGGPPQNGHGSPIHQMPSTGMYGNFNYPGQMPGGMIPPRMGPGGLPQPNAQMGLMYGGTQPGMGMGMPGGMPPQAIMSGQGGIAPQGIPQPGMNQQPGGIPMQQGPVQQGIPQNQPVHPGNIPQQGNQQQQQQQTGMPPQQQINQMPQQYQPQMAQPPINQPPPMVPPQQQQQAVPIQQPSHPQPAPPADIPKPQAPPNAVQSPQQQSQPVEQPPQEAVVETAELISFD